MISRHDNQRNQKEQLGKQTEGPETQKRWREVKDQVGTLLAWQRGSQAGWAAPCQTLLCNHLAKEAELQGLSPGRESRLGRGKAKEGAKVAHC